MESFIVACTCSKCKKRTFIDIKKRPDGTIRTFSGVISGSNLDELNADWTMTNFAVCPDCLPSFSKSIQDGAQRWDAFKEALKDRKTKRPHP